MRDVTAQRVEQVVLARAKGTAELPQDAEPGPPGSCRLSSRRVPTASAGINYLVSVAVIVGVVVAGTAAMDGGADCRSDMSSALLLTQQYCGL